MIVKLELGTLFLGGKEFLGSEIFRPTTNMLKISETLYNAKKFIRLIILKTTGDIGINMSKFDLSNQSLKFVHILTNSSGSDASKISSVLDPLIWLGLDYIPEQ